MFGFFRNLFYGPERGDDYRFPWDRDEDLDRGREERLARRRRRFEEEDDSRERRGRDDIVTNESDERVNKKFHVRNVNLNIQKNTKEHHTDRFMCTKRERNQELVVRRGQSFIMTITFDRPYNNQENEIYFHFKTGKRPMTSKSTSIKLNMSEDPTSTGDVTQWFAKMVYKTDTSIDVEIKPPCNCIIGEWRFTIQTESKLKEENEPISLMYEHNEDVIVILNPWCKDDQVYMGKESLLDEYILNESGAIFVGNYYQRSIKPWNFGQFQDEILSICLHLIRKGFNNVIDPGMGDVVKLSRVISKMVNAQDDNGIVSGNWSGDYTGGTAPFKWVGSVAVLKEYEDNNGTPVKFGQCWVFSGITTTVCRAIGMPARSISNFSSAHDTDGTTTIDKVFVRDRNELVEKEMPDSIWNFHVWNEAWMTRIDLGKGYEGWQVIDATPQETSEGIYCCGPAPVIAIKHGEISKVNYDAPFIFAEVNADIVSWEMRGPPANDMIVIKAETKSVGRFISTKKPDGKPYNGNVSIWRDDDDYRLDVTSEYKFPEGSLGERLAVEKADKAAKLGRDVFKVSESKDISMTIANKDGFLVGNDFEVEVQLKNIKSERGRRTIEHLQVVVDSLKYTGQSRKNIVKKTFENIKLDFREEKTVTFTVKTDEYWDKMYELFGMEITAFAYVKETGNYYLKKDDFRLRRPDILVKAPRVVQVREPFELKLSFKNTLPVPLTNCSLLIEGNGIKNKKSEESDVPPQSQWSTSQMLEAETNGELQINVSFDCHELKDIVGLVVITSKD